MDFHCRRQPVSGRKWWVRTWAVEANRRVQMPALSVLGESLVSLLSPHLQNDHPNSLYFLLLALSHYL